MAIHPNLQSMLRESLPEMLLVAKYCIEFRKDTSIWSASGCYGYPAALILLSIADCQVPLLLHTLSKRFWLGIYP